MCKVYHDIGSLTAIKSHLRQHHVNDFKSLKEVIDFQRNYAFERQQIISTQTKVIEQEKYRLSEEIIQMKDYLATSRGETREKLLLELKELKEKLNGISSEVTNPFRIIKDYFMERDLKRRILDIEQNFDSKIDIYNQPIVNILNNKSNRFQFIFSNFSEAVDQSSTVLLRELDRKKRVVDELNTSIYGAIGEQKVAKELEKLSDDYVLINDFYCSFTRPIYNRKEKDYIKSIQIDHLLVAPSGVFLIETKNWSEASLQNLNLRSPVSQIKRTSFALFKMLSGKVSGFLDRHHWGDRNIPIRNLIVLINHKPNETFQHVKILTLNELLGYIEYFDPVFSSLETKTIANYLLQLRDDSDNP